MRYGIPSKSGLSEVKVLALISILLRIYDQTSKTVFTSDISSCMDDLLRVWMQNIATMSCWRRYDVHRQELVDKLITSMSKRGQVVIEANAWE